MNNIIFARELKGLKPKDVAKGARIDFKLYERLETGEKLPEIEDAKKLGEYYGVNYEYFLINSTHVSNFYTGTNSRGIFNTTTYNEASAELIEKLLEEREKRIKELVVK